MIFGDREKWDGSKPKDKSDDEAGKDRQEKKLGGQGPEFEGPSTNSEDAKHDGP